MGELLVCNTGSDSISKINMDDFKVGDISLEKDEIRNGPFDICETDKNIIITNTYKNTIQFLDKEKNDVLEEFYIGEGPKSVKKYLDKLIVTCSESDSISVFDLNKKSIDFIFRNFNYPSSIDIDNKTGLLYVCNLGGDRLDIIDFNNFILKRSLILKGRPEVVKLSKDNKFLFVAEDFLEEEELGFLNIYNLKTLKLLKRIKVGEIPSSICEGDKYLFVSNLGDGTVSIIDLKEKIKKYTLKIGGMPINVKIYNDNIFICDYSKNKVLVLDEKFRKIKNIAVGSEPNAMLIINPYH